MRIARVAARAEAARHAYHFLERAALGQHEHDGARAGEAEGAIFVRSWRASQRPPIRRRRAQHANAETGRPIIEQQATVEKRSAVKCEMSVEQTA